MTPGPYSLVLLALAAYRLWRLIAADDVTAPLRARVLGLGDAAWGQWAYAVGHAQMLGDPWTWYTPKWARERSDEWWRTIIADATGDENARVPPIVAYDAVVSPPVGRARWWLGSLVHCPYCLGLWISVAAYAAWRAWPGATLAASSVLAASLIVGALHTALTRLAGDT